MKKYSLTFLAFLLILLSLTSPIYLNFFFRELTSQYRTEFQILLRHFQVISTILSFLFLSFPLLLKFPLIKKLMNSLLIPLLLVLTSTLIVFLIIETSLHFHFRNVAVGGLNSPAHFTFFKKYYKLNNLRFRDKERSIKKPPNTYRIVVLGDSHTFGAGIQNQSDIYTQLLEEKLNSTYENKFEVINTAVNGQNTLQQLQFLQKNGLLLEPDLLILGYFLNDAETDFYKRKYASNVTKGHFLPYPYGKFLNAFSYTYFFLRVRIQQILIRLNNRKESFYSFDDYVHDLYGKDNLASYQIIYEDLMLFCRDNQLKILVFFIPKLGKLKQSEEYPFQYIHNFIRHETVKYEMPFIDLLPTLKTSRIENITVNKTNSHMSSDVHQLVSELLFNWFQENKPWEKQIRK